jgi:NAD(P)-dependent dehydrogenase (short-subunit alcohol dehydrogenase family)
VENLEGRVAVVTGSGGGMGRSIALTLARARVQVVIADIEADAAEKVRDEAVAEGLSALAAPTDVSRLEDVEALADRAYGEFGKVDILVNNAAVVARPARASWDTSYEDIAWILGVNFWGVWHGHHVFVPRMLEQPGDKHIVNTSSVATLRAGLVQGNSSYVASKGAVDGFSLAAASELATQNIGLTILYPSAVNTRIPTSERLRPEHERSEVRGVRPWSSYLGPGAGARDPRYAGMAEDPPGELIDPDRVGPMVLEAIKENRRYCLTHPAPEDDLRTRVDEIVAGYRGG